MIEGLAVGGLDVADLGLQGCVEVHQVSSVGAGAAPSAAGADVLIRRLVRVLLIAIGATLPDVLAELTSAPARRSVCQAWQSARAQTPAVGAKCVTRRRIGGASRPCTSELVHIDPPRTWGVRGIDRPIRAAVDVLVEPVADSRSRLTISVDFTGHSIGKILCR